MNIKFMISLILVTLANPVFADVQITNPSNPTPVVSQNFASPSPSTTPSTPATFTVDEKTYLIAAYRYMGVEQNSGLMIAATMSKLASRGATSQNLGDAIKIALSDITVAHSIYSQTAVPAKYANVDAQINNIFTQFGSLYIELLKYWSDGNEAHIDNSSVPLQKAAVQQRNILLELTNIIGKDNLQY
jgi:hypothetical protein